MMLDSGRDVRSFLRSSRCACASSSTPRVQPSQPLPQSFFASVPLRLLFLDLRSLRIAYSTPLSYINRSFTIDNHREPSKPRLITSPQCFALRQAMSLIPLSPKPQMRILPLRIGNIYSFVTATRAALPVTNHWPQDVCDKVGQSEAGYARPKRTPRDEVC